MTREETIKVLAVLKAAYPASYRNMTKDEANGVVMIWATQFAAAPLQVVMIAVQRLISTNTFPPTISEVKSALRGLYWEAEMQISQHVNGFCPLDKNTLAAVHAIKDGCQKYQFKGREVSLSELLEGHKQYLNSGEGLIVK